MIDAIANLPDDRTDDLIMLQRFGDVIAYLAQALSNETIQYDRRSTRLLIQLYDQCHRLEKTLHRCLAHIALFQEQSQKGWQVYWMHKVGLDIATFERQGNRLTLWIHQRYRLFKHYHIWKKNTPLAQMWSAFNDDGEEDAVEMLWSATISRIRTTLQATRSPHPDRFPDLDELMRIKTLLESLENQFRNHQKQLYEFTTTHIQINQLFDPS